MEALVSVEHLLTKDDKTVGPPIVINLEKDRRRYEDIHDHLAQWGIEPERFSALSGIKAPYVRSDMVESPHVISLNLSHAAVSRKCLLGSEKKYWLVLEDDCRFVIDPRKIVAFVLKSLQGRDWSVVSLGCFSYGARPDPVLGYDNFSFERPGDWHPWGAHAYLVNRNHAKRLVEHWSALWDPADHIFHAEYKNNKGFLLRPAVAYQEVYKSYQSKFTKNHNYKQTADMSPALVKKIVSISPPTTVDFIISSSGKEEKLELLKYVASKEKNVKIKFFEHEEPSSQLIKHVLDTWADPPDFYVFAPRIQDKSSKSEEMLVSEVCAAIKEKKDVPVLLSNSDLSAWQCEENMSKWWLNTFKSKAPELKSAPAVLCASARKIQSWGQEAWEKMHQQTAGAKDDSLKFIENSLFSIFHGKDEYLTITNQENYTNVWFENGRRNFESLTHLFSNRAVRGVEIGSFEGRSSNWIVDNWCSHTGSSLTCVDPFMGSDEHTTQEKSGLYERFLSNTKRNAKKIRVIKSQSIFALAHLIESEEKFDFAYVDGDHHSLAVLADAVLVDKVLKIGGIIAFDDYMWGTQLPLYDRPKESIDHFFKVMGDRYQILISNYQIFGVKKK